MELNRRRIALFSVASLLLIVAVELWVFSLENRARVKAIRMHFYIILEVLIFLMARYTWKRISLLLQWTQWLPIAAVIKLLVLIMLGLAQGALVIGPLFLDTDPPLITVLANRSLGVVIFLTASLVTVDICSYIVRKLFCKSFNKGKDLRIRTVFALCFTFVLLCTGVIGLTRFTIERIRIPVKGLDSRLNGTTILQMSDIHLGPFNGRTQLVKLLESVNELDADIVVITGDLVDSSVVSLRETVKPLVTIKSKCGVYFSTGNHEYYTGDVDSWIQELPKLNVTPLINGRVCLLSGDHETCEGGLYLAGLEDIETRRFNYGPHSMDLHAALSGRKKGIPTVVLAHQPWAAVEAIMWEDVRLVLSGHTHAGQILPTMAFIYLVNPFMVGLYEPLPNVFVYVNPGSLYFLVPFRHYRPEITYITLVST